ncbi:MAG: hypothetical protein JSW41_01505 [Candidatus Aenigmatarchaeota archaeon]|nr:MAG: hypothetical protein JSW41_01505 [Candidatus Aenigmarchaeota archaeon]
MDDKLTEKVNKKLKEGWIKSTMMIEVLAVTEEAAKESLEKHIDRMEKEEKALIYRKNFKKIDKVKNPLPKITEAYSNVVELELLTQNYDKLVYMVMTYVPSSVEILEPGHIKMDMGEAQGVLNSIAELIHKFAAAGIGGVIIGT